MSAGRARRLMADLPGARRARQAATKRPRWPWRCAAHVTTPLRLAANETTWRTAVASYRLRHDGLAFHLRHPYQDVWIFEEIFHRRVYEIPAPVQRAVAELGRPPRILDVGGHIGLGALFLLSRWPDATVTSVEPDPANRAVLAATIAQNAAQGRWTVIGALAGTAPGSTRFVSEGHLSRPADVDDGGAPTIEVEQIDALPLLADADVAKMDIQGGEWPILADRRLAERGPLAIAVEYHPQGCSAPDPRAEAERLLAEAGYTRVGGIRDEHANEGTFWAVRGS